MNNLLRVASELDKCGQYRLSDKLFLIAQNQNPFAMNQQEARQFGKMSLPQQALSAFYNTPQGQNIGLLVDPKTRSQYINKVNFVNNLGGSAASKVDEIKGYAEQGVQKASNLSALGKLGASISKNLPTLIQGLKKVSTLLEKVNETPAGKLASKALLVLNVHSVVANGLELLTDLQTKGLSEVWNTDAKRVVQTFANLVALGTNPTVTGYLLPLAAILPTLTTISGIANGVSLAAEVVDAAGGFMGTTNTALRNNQGTNAKSSVMPLDQLSKKYGEVYNVLIDYVNSRGTVQQLISKHIPDNNPEKFALVNAHIAQKVLPPKNAPYAISSYKRQRDELAVSSNFGGI
jgi:hypothetical protein